MTWARASKTIRFCEGVSDLGDCVTEAYPCFVCHDTESLLIDKDQVPSSVLSPKLEVARERPGKLLDIREALISRGDSKFPFLP